MNILIIQKIYELNLTYYYLIFINYSYFYYT